MATPFLLSTLSLRSSRARDLLLQHRTGGVLGARTPTPPPFPLPILHLHGFPSPPPLAPVSLRDSLLSRVIPRIPPSVSAQTHWKLPSTMRPREALQVSSTLALRLPSHLAKGHSLPTLLSHTLASLDDLIRDSPSMRREWETWVVLDTLAPSVQACVAGLLKGTFTLGSGGDPSSPSPTTATTQAVAISNRFLSLLSNFTVHAGDKGEVRRRRLGAAQELLTLLPATALPLCSPLYSALCNKVAGSGIMAEAWLTDRIKMAAAEVKR